MSISSSLYKVLKEAYTADQTMLLVSNALDGYPFHLEDGWNKSYRNFITTKGKNIGYAKQEYPNLLKIKIFNKIKTLSIAGYDESDYTFEQKVNEIRELINELLKKEPKSKEDKSNPKYEQQALDI